MSGDFVRLHCYVNKFDIVVDFWKRVMGFPEIEVVQGSDRRRIEVQLPSMIIVFAEFNDQASNPIEAKFAELYEKAINETGNQRPVFPGTASRIQFEMSNMDDTKVRWTEFVSSWREQGENISVVDNYPVPDPNINDPAIYLQFETGGCYVRLIPGAG